MWKPHTDRFEYAPYGKPAPATIRTHWCPHCGEELLVDHGIVDSKNRIGIDPEGRCSLCHHQIADQSDRNTIIVGRVIAAQGAKIWIVRKECLAAGTAGKNHRCRGVG